MIRAAPTAAIAGVLGLATLVVYLGTLAPGLLGGDAGELQFVSPILGLTHPTGYPLLVLLNHAWALVFPVGSVAWRLNVLNAIFASAAIAVLFGLSTGVTRCIRAAALGVMFLAFAPVYWSQATGSDKYTLNALLLALVLFLAWRWSQRPDVSRLSVLGLAFGVSLANHRSMFLAAPGLLMFLLLHGWRPWPLRALVMPLLLLLAPLFLYVYVPWAGSRGLPPGTWPVGTTAELVEYFLDRGYTSQIRVDDGAGARLLEFGRVALLQIGHGGLALGAIGVIVLARISPHMTVLLATVLLPNLVAAANYLLPSNYAIPRYWVFFIPVYLVWTVFIAAAVSALLEAARREVKSSPASEVVQGLALLAVVGLGAVIWGPAALTQARMHRSAETLDGYRQDLQRGHLADRFARLAFKEAEYGTVIVGDWEQVTTLWYLQLVEGLRSDVHVRYPIERLDDTLRDPAFQGRSVAITRALPGVERYGTTSSVGPLILVRPGVAPPTTSELSSVDAVFDGTAQLLGSRYLDSQLTPGRVLPLTLFWQAIGRDREDASVSVRLVNDAGQDVAQSDAPHPVLGTSPMSRWPGETLISDYHELAVSNRLPPGSYAVEVLLYRGPQAAPLAVTGSSATAGGDRARLGYVDVR